MAGDDHDFGVRVILQLLEQLQPASIGELEIQKDQIERSLLQQGLGAGERSFRFDRVESQRLEPLGEELSGRFRIFDDEGARHRSLLEGCGSRSATTARGTGRIPDAVAVSQHHPSR